MAAMVDNHQRAFLKLEAERFEDDEQLAKQVLWLKLSGAENDNAGAKCTGGRENCAEIEVLSE